MGSLITILLRVFYVCLFPIFLLFPFLALAADVTLTPSLELKGEYDDNVSFLPRDEKADFLATLSPSLILDYDTELLNLDSKVAVSFLRYAEEKYLDTQNEYYELSGTYTAFERFQVRGEYSYVEDTTLESELEETGLIGVRSERERSKASGGVSYRMTELSDIGFDYTHSETDYDWPENVDYEYDGVTLSNNWRLRNNRDVLTIQSSYGLTDSSISKVDNYSLSAGWAHQFTESMDLKVFLGPRYTRIEYNPFEVNLPPEEPLTDTTWGVVADISLQQYGEKYTVTAGYNRDLGRSFSGETIETDKLYCSVARRIRRRTLIRFSGRLYFTKAEEETPTQDVRHFDIGSAIEHEITETLVLQFAYRYAYHNVKGLSFDDTYARNRIWVALILKFPEKY